MHPNTRAFGKNARYTRTLFVAVMLLSTPLFTQADTHMDTQANMPIGFNAIERLPEWMIPLRDAVYGQSLTADEVMPLHLEASAAAWRHTTGAGRYVALSHAQYFMGRSMFSEGRIQGPFPFSRRHGTCRNRGKKCSRCGRMGVTRKKP